MPLKNTDSTEKEGSCGTVTHWRIKIEKIKKVIDFLIVFRAVAQIPTKGTPSSSLAERQKVSFLTPEGREARRKESLSRFRRLE